METQKNATRKTGSIATLALTAAAALTFVGCNKDNSHRVMAEQPERGTNGAVVASANGTNGVSYASLYGTNSQSTVVRNHNGSSGWFWWWYLSRPGYAPHATAGITPAESHAYTTPRSYSAPHVSEASAAHVSVARGGFGSVGRAAAVGAAC